MHVIGFEFSWRWLKDLYFGVTCVRLTKSLFILSACGDFQTIKLGKVLLIESSDFWSPPPLAPLSGGELSSGAMLVRSGLLYGVTEGRGCVMKVIYKNMKLEKDPSVEIWL